MGPLYKFGSFDFAYSLQVAGFIGFCFGFVLERAGFGNPRKLTAVFYLKDFAVLKVMFTAIVVCIVGLLYFSIFGWIDIGRVYILPTFIWPMIAAGFILGVGFVVGGYCPTTSVVATVSGKLDGLIFIVGMIIGSIVFAELFPLLEGFYTAGDMGQIRLSDVFKINSGLVAFLACLMAVGAYWVVEKVERRLGDPDMLPLHTGKAKKIAAGLLVAFGLILAILNPDQIAAQRWGKNAEPTQKSETLEKTVPKASQAPSTFKIVDDEGC